MHREDTFRFKQFDIIQNQEVHRVGTDGVLLGAWVDISGVQKILDVGTGTGVIALMLAQRVAPGTPITALEPDANACALAGRNIESSRFSESLQVTPERIQDYTGEQFDLVVCNPPFFHKSLKPPATKRASQRHTVDLTFEDLLRAASSLLSRDGTLNLVLPVEEGNGVVQLSKQFDFQVSRQCTVFSKPGKKAERYLLEFSKRASIPVETSLTIMDVHGEWTPEYKNLTRDFYLNF